MERFEKDPVSAIFYLFLPMNTQQPIFHRFVLAFSTGLAVCASLVAQEKKSPQARLQKLFKAFPDADTDKDGKLTLDEAKAYPRFDPSL